jgi:hypothetical protein
MTDIHRINAERNSDGTVFDDATSTLLRDNNLFDNFIMSTRSRRKEREDIITFYNSSSAFSNDLSSNFNSKGITGIESEVFGNAGF